jgi:sec-independent protein translocase protein TatA
MFGKGIGLPELLIILVIVLLLFGPSRLSKVAGEIGKGIKSFRDNMNQDDKGDEEKKDDDQPQSPTGDK